MVMHELRGVSLSAVDWRGTNNGLGLKDTHFTAATAAPASGRVVIGDHTGSVYLLHASETKMGPRELHVHQGAITCLAADTHHIVTGGEDGMVNVFSPSLSLTGRITCGGQIRSIFIQEADLLVNCGGRLIVIQDFAGRRAIDASQAPTLRHTDEP
jgi:hypothetical protein